MGIEFTILAEHLVIAYLVICYSLAIPWCRRELKKVCRINNGDYCFWTMIWALAPIWVPFSVITKTVFAGIKR